VHNVSKLSIGKTPNSQPLKSHAYDRCHFSILIKFILDLNQIRQISRDSSLATRVETESF
jgi:hypothetical protein